MEEVKLEAESCATGVGERNIAEANNLTVRKELSSKLLKRVWSINKYIINKEITFKDHLKVTSSLRIK
jgi:hypothetical protein